MKNWAIISLVLGIPAAAAAQGGVVVSSLPVSVISVSTTTVPREVEEPLVEPVVFAEPLEGFLHRELPDSVISELSQQPLSGKGVSLRELARQGRLKLVTDRLSNPVGLAGAESVGLSFMLPSGVDRKALKAELEKADAPEPPPPPKGRDVSEWSLARGGLALKGADPVSYFTDEVYGPVRGRRKFSLVHEGVKYRFESARNMRLFGRSPSRFEPAYGGWCAYSMARGRKETANPGYWRITDGRLYVFARGNREKWEPDEAALRRRADYSWARLNDREDSEAPPPQEEEASRKRPGSEYYDQLERRRCRDRQARRCCRASIKRMRRGGFERAPGPNLRYAGCPMGTVPAQLKCRGSQIWCAPSGGN